MIEEAIDEKELAFLSQLEEHENEWVAFIQEDGAETVVGSGKDAVEAARDAEEHGFPDAVLMKVPRFDVALILQTSLNSIPFATRNSTIKKRLVSQSRYRT